MLNKIRVALRPLAFALAAFVAAFAVVPAPVAHAQMSQAVASPLTTKRLERLLKVYVAPTAEEATAVDRLHEAYLAKFRAELDPEIQAVGRGMGGGMPSQQEFEKFLRDLDRLQAKISEADNAFFDSASNLLAEERRPGMQRIREARERQRNLSGFARMGPMMFGGGGSFVDLADLLARDEFTRQLDGPQREQFDALLRTQEQRLLSQSRNYGDEIRKAFDKMYAIISGFEATAAEPAAEGDAADPGAAMRAQMERMQQMMQQMRALGTEANRVVGLNAEANRAAIRQFAPILPELAYHRMRGDVAERSLGVMGMFATRFGRGEVAPGSGDLATLLVRLRRDPEVTADMRERFAPIELAWRRERADNAEKFAGLVGGMDSAAMMMGGMNPDGGMSESMLEMQRVAEAREEIDQRAYRAVAAIIGPEKSDVVFGKTTTFVAGEGGAAPTGTEVLRPNTLMLELQEEAQAEPVDAADAVGYMGSAAMLNAEPVGWSASQVARVLRPLGVSESSLAVLEGVVDGWRSREWDAKVVPLGRQLSETVVGVYRSEPAAGTDPGEAPSIRVAQEKQAKLPPMRRQVLDAAFAADAVLFGELAAALGLAPDSAEMLALRLERVQMATDFAGGMGGGPVYVTSPSAVLLRAEVPAEAARAFLENSREDWKALAETLQEEVLAVVAREERQQKAMIDAQANSDWQGVQRVTAANAAEAAAFGKRYGDLLDGAAAKASDSRDVAAAIRRARLALARPDVYKSKDSAMPQLKAALRLDGLSDGQRSRLEALEAEYEAVYEMLSEKVAAARPEVDPNDGEAWRTMQERFEAEQKLLFQRNERTEKARSEARRILGDDLASRVRGLVPDEDDVARRREVNRFDPLSEEDD